MRTNSIASITSRAYNINMRDNTNWNLVDFNCINCGEIIKAFPSRDRKYCKKCTTNRQVLIKCKFCLKQILKHPSRGARYCSRLCWRKDQFGKKYPPEFGAKVSATKLSMPVKTIAGGYKRANKYLYPQTEPCAVCNTKEKIDRHHIDKNPKNNIRSNIKFLCKLHHQRLHKNWLDRWGKR